MLEVKFISHITRNTYSFIIAYLMLTLVADFSLSWQMFVLCAATFTLGYAPVYFLNDLCDREDDKVNGKDNVYNAIGNQKLFYGLWFILAGVGLFISWFLAKEAFVILAVLYGLNALYSVPPWQVRNRPILREILIAVIYTFKWLWIISAIQFPYQHVPWLLIGLVACYAAAVVVMYKKHKQPRPWLEYGLSGLLLIVWINTAVRYPNLVLFIAPMLLAIIYYHFFYKESQKGYNKHQIAYLIYALAIYGIMRFVLQF